jgi:hypothetical protein
MWMLLLGLLAGPPKGTMVWNHNGVGVTYWALCIDDDCVEVPKDRAKTSTPGAWQLPKPKTLDDGHRHLVSVQACLKSGKRDLCSAPDSTSYQKK